METINKQIDGDTWENTYKPKINHIDPEASWQVEDGGGRMFETYGAERDFVLEQDERYVWSYVDSDLGTCLVAGIPYGNVIGYFVCEVPWDDADLVVVVSHDSDAEDSYAELLGDLEQATELIRFMAINLEAQAKIINSINESITLIRTHALPTGHELEID